jgi:hypothetical protein
MTFTENVPKVSWKNYAIAKNLRDDFFCLMTPKSETSDSDGKIFMEKKYGNHQGSGLRIHFPTGSGGMAFRSTDEAALSGCEGWRLSDGLLFGGIGAGAAHIYQFP